VGFLDKVLNKSPNVRFAGKYAYNMKSRVTTVVGDEPGVGGGVVSGVNKGFCRPITFSAPVRVNKANALFHLDTIMWMNCAGPEGPGNTIGIVRYLAPMKSASVGPAGEIAPADPPVAPETPAESSCFDALLKQFGSMESIVELAQKAYGLSTTDWSNPGSVLAAFGGVAGMAGFGQVAQMPGMAQKAYSIATADWSNPGAIMGAAVNLGGIALGSGGGFGSNPRLTGVPAGTGSSIPPGVIMGGCF
jgi:hypothetical protein